MVAAIVGAPLAGAPAVGGRVPAIGGHAPADGGHVPAVGGHVPAVGGRLPAVGGRAPAGCFPALGGLVPPLRRRSGPSAGVRCVPAFGRTLPAAVGARSFVAFARPRGTDGKTAGFAKKGGAGGGGDCGPRRAPGPGPREARVLHCGPGPGGPAWGRWVRARGPGLAGRPGPRGGGPGPRWHSWEAAWPGSSVKSRVSLSRTGLVAGPWPVLEVEEPGQVLGRPEPIRAPGLEDPG